MEMRHRHRTLVESLVFGTMRMHERSVSIAYWVDFFSYLHSFGIRTLHSSTEYESFDFFCTVLNQLKSAHADIQFKHIVKLAEPSFNDKDYSSDRLNQKIENYLKRLDVQQIDCVQWMWRADLKQEEDRCDKFEKTSNQIADDFTELKRIGKVVRVGCFPYTPGFAALALIKPFVDNLVVYRNPMENEYDHLFDQVQSLGKQVIALRPFAAGKALNLGPRTLMEYAFAHPAVKQVVFKASSKKHLEELNEADV